VDYLFLQVVVDEATVSARQNCGNLLAGVGPFAVERGLVRPGGDTTSVRIHMVNTGGLAVAHVPTPAGAVRYSGATEISGVPRPAAGIALDFTGTQGSTCGALLEALRRSAGPLMNLGDVAGATIPKMTLIAPPMAGGALCTRTFIPHRCHTSIGVLGAVAVATGAAIDGSVAASLVARPLPDTVRLEHPTGFFDARVVLEPDGVTVARSGVVRTARKLFDGVTWPWEPERYDT
jgi:4-oxalomesaconate tautomerase